MIRRIARWVRTRARILLPYLLVVGAAVGVVAVVVHNDHEQTRRTNAEVHQRCLDRQTDRQVLRTVVDISFSSGASVDLTKVPGFDALDSNMQTFVRNLADDSKRSSPPQRRALHDQLLAQLTPIICQETR